MRQKVTIVGAGYVGATTAQYIVEKDLADVVLVDILEGIPQGKGLDLLQAGAIEGYGSFILGTNEYKETADSDIIVIVAGFPRQPGMSRDDLLMKNAAVVGHVTEETSKFSPHAIIVVVTNPLDAMTQLALVKSGLPRHRVVGMAGILDCARFRTFIAQELHVAVENVQTLILGGHGETMVPLPRYTTVAGIPVTALLSEAKLAALMERTRRGGDEIVALLKTGSAFYAPGAAITEMVEAILKDKKKILPCCAYLEGAYGINNLCLGVPVKLGREGIEDILEVSLTPDEQAALHRSAEAVRQLVEKLGI